MARETKEQPQWSRGKSKRLFSLENQVKKYILSKKELCKLFLINQIRAGYK